MRQRFVAAAVDMSALAILTPMNESEIVFGV
jgi:hypothetical protein